VVSDVPGKQPAARLLCDALGRAHQVLDDEGNTGEGSVGGAGDWLLEWRRHQRVEPRLHLLERRHRCRSNLLGGDIALVDQFLEAGRVELCVVAYLHHDPLRTSACGTT